MVVNKEEMEMVVVINGKNSEIQSEFSVTELLKIQQVENPELVSVQLNGEFLYRDKYDSTLIKEKDEVDFLYFMGGGSR
jgi:sulfur carrier protein